MIRPSARWEDKMGIGKEIYEDVDCIHLTQDMVQWWAGVNTVMNFRVN
jgi:hypothetical protein